MSISSRIRTELDEDIKINRGRYSPNEIFKKYVTIEEIKKHPEITPAIRGDKKLKLDILSHQKPRIISIKGIQNQNKVKFASRLNSFNKIFFDYYKNNLKSKDEINTLSQENKNFAKKYKNSNSNKDIFHDIKSEYEKRNYYVSSLEEKKNIFNGNILLSNKEELKNYILYDLGTPTSNVKALSFLHKINKNLGDKTSEKELKKINNNLDMIILGKDKIGEDQNNEIQKTQNDINNVKETINSMDEINNFLDLDNKKYLEMIKNDSSRGSSAKISTRVNSALNCFENVKYQYNINPPNKKMIIKGNSLINIKNKNIMNKNQNIKTKPKFKSRMTRINNIITNNISNRNQQQRKFSNKYTKTLDYDSLGNSPLEQLYDHISTKENLLYYQPDIKNYLNNRKFDISVKINPSFICNNFEKTREKICQSDFLKQDMQLRKQIEGNVSNAENINNKDLKTKDKINNIEDKIIKLYCDINNPRKTIE